MEVIPSILTSDFWRNWQISENQSNISIKFTNFCLKVDKITSKCSHFVLKSLKIVYINLDILKQHTRLFFTHYSWRSGHSDWLQRNFFIYLRIQHKVVPQFPLTSLCIVPDLFCFYSSLTFILSGTCYKIVWNDNFRQTMDSADHFTFHFTLRSHNYSLSRSKLQFTT